MLSSVYCILSSSFIVSRFSLQEAEDGGAPPFPAILLASTSALWVVVVLFSVLILAVQIAPDILQAVALSFEPFDLFHH